MKTKKVKFSVINIIPNEIMPTSLLLGEKLNRKLKDTKSIENRIFYLNEKESEDVDFISNFSFIEDKGIFYGTFIRLNTGIQTILKAKDLKQQTIEISKIIKESSADNAGSIKALSFFCIKNDTLVMTSAYDCRRALSNYCLWLIQKVNSNIEFTFEQRVDTQKKLNGADIKSVKLGSNYFNFGDKSAAKEFSPAQKSFRILQKNILRTLFKMAEIDDDYMNCIRATLVLTFDKKRLEKADLLKNAINLVANTEDIIVTDRGGRKYSGASFSVYEECDIELTSEGTYNKFEIDKRLEDMVQRYNN